MIDRTTLTFVKPERCYFWQYLSLHNLGEGVELGTNQCKTRSPLGYPDSKLLYGIRVPRKNAEQPVGHDVWLTVFLPGLAVQSRPKGYARMRRIPNKAKPMVSSFSNFQSNFIFDTVGESFPVHIYIHLSSCNVSWLLLFCIMKGFLKESSCTNSTKIPSKKEIHSASIVCRRWVERWWCMMNPPRSFRMFLPRMCNRDAKGTTDSLVNVWSKRS